MTMVATSLVTFSDDGDFLGDGGDLPGDGDDHVHHLPNLLGDGGDQQTPTEWESESASS